MECTNRRGNESHASAPRRPLDETVTWLNPLSTFQGSLLTRVTYAEGAVTSAQTLTADVDGDPATHELVPGLPPRRSVTNIGDSCCPPAYRADELSATLPHFLTNKSVYMRIPASNVPRFF
ncbi:hypothetical protein GWI33_008190 [Rhynchophorus ferrugineus]|uniref:Uncharacterized protein n=1 Tax=Rhynchophorus ferrugineus TaxID=354439 RepID=A0A834IGY6_RHYFE|nr:hypothetical protein GWI33_008190 [Rhynchophorus ferrugineus]